MQDNFNKESESCLHLLVKENQNVSISSTTNVLNDEIFENIKSFLLDQA